MHKVLTLLFLVLCFYGKGFSETIEVTNNADTGPGTFREALARAAASGLLLRDRSKKNLRRAYREFDFNQVNN